MPDLLPQSMFRGPPPDRPPSVTPRPPSKPPPPQSGCPFASGGSSFRCNEWDFVLDISYALSALSDRGGFQLRKVPDPITLSLHPHPLIYFSRRNEFIEGGSCKICRGSVEGDGYTCLHRQCMLLIHRRCIQDLYYADGTKAPRVFHDHPLEIFVREDTDSIRCANCGSDKSGEFISCASCQVYYHKDCIQDPEILRYPPHLDHTLVLFMVGPNSYARRCKSCSSFLKVELCYGCSSCSFFMNVRCALQTLAYCEEGGTLD